MTPRLRSYLCSISLIVSLLASASLVQGQDISVADCTHNLGGNYDQLSEAQKEARLLNYGGCVHRLARGKLNRAYTDITRRVDDWRDAALDTANTEIDSLASSERDRMRVRHETERDRLESEYQGQFDSLDQPTRENNSQIQQQRNAITSSQRQAGRSLQQQQRAEQTEFTAQIRTSKQQARQETNQLVAEDKENLAQQYDQKSNAVDAVLDFFKNVFVAPQDQAQESDVSLTPIGTVRERVGNVFISRSDGTRVPAEVGTPVYQYDVFETEPDATTDIVFVDETTFSLGSNAKLEMDEYIYDPAPADGPDSAPISILKGLFVFTSGLIGRDDPDVTIDNPHASIGTRG